MPARKNSPRLMSEGIFPNAEVVRGHDWLWGDQDGMYVISYICISHSTVVLHI